MCRSENPLWGKNYQSPDCPETCDTVAHKKFYEKGKDIRWPVRLSSKLELEKMERIRSGEKMQEDTKIRRNPEEQTHSKGRAQNEETLYSVAQMLRGWRHDGPKQSSGPSQTLWDPSLQASLFVKFNDSTLYEFP